MKTNVTFLAIALATFQTVALAQPTQNLSAASKPAASTLVEKPDLLVFTVLLDLNQPVNPGPTTISRVGNMSSRPWTEIVGWHNGQSTARDPENHEAQLYLLTLRF